MQSFETIVFVTTGTTILLLPVVLSNRHNITSSESQYWSICQRYQANKISLWAKTLAVVAANATFYCSNFLP